MQSLEGKVAIVTGGSRGIGRECCLALAREKCRVVVAAKSTSAKPGLPGSIFTVAQEVEALGAEALPIALDVRDPVAIQACVDATIKKWRRVDILINNASALWWNDIEGTPMKKYDLIMTINARGSFAMAQACLPHMKKNGWGRVICMSPPIHLQGLKGMVAYYMSKFGMTLVALGVAQEYRGQGIAAHSLWPATVIESQASKNFAMGERGMWRKATILSDATVRLCKEPNDYTGQMLIDDVYLRERHGFVDADFVQYRCDPAIEPPRLLASEANEGSLAPMRRGDVRKLAVDQRADIFSKL
eukprot:g31929.t1